MWNLGVGVALAAVPACGPAVAVPGDDDGGPGSASGPVTEGPVQCQTRADCAEDYYCLQGQCVPEAVSDDHYYQESYYLDDGCYGDCCYYGDGCYDYDDCYEDDDCGFGEICRVGGTGYMECQPAPAIEECDEELALIPLPVAATGGDVVSLNFVDANGDNRADLAIGHGDDVEIVFGPGTGAATWLTDVATGAAFKVIDGDFNGDAYRDLALSDLESVTVLAGAADGTFTSAGQVEAAGDPVELYRLDWDGQGADDIATLTEQREIPVVAGTALDAAYELDHPNVRNIAVGDFDGDGLDDVVTNGVYDVKITFGNGTGDVFPDLTFDHDGSGDAEAIMGRFDPLSPSVLVRLDMNDGATLVEAHSIAGTYTPQLLDTSENIAEAAADLDGDGIEDLVVLSWSGLAVAFGGPHGEDNRLFRCQSRANFGPASVFMAVGDVDGAGQAEIALSDGETVTVYSMP